MTGLFRFAHLTDPHLPLLPGDFHDRSLLTAKRLSGIQSWQRKRRHIHRPEILEAAVADIRAHEPEHVVLTGDIVNVALPAEFKRADEWLAALGSPGNVTIVPGNHDAYVETPWSDGAGRWHAYMKGDEGMAPGGSPEGLPFPFVRVRGPVAFVGLSTAVSTPLFSAMGRLGASQIALLGPILEKLGRQGLLRVVLLHHPPACGASSRRKGLKDYQALRGVLAQAGAELVLHGHTHMAMFDRLTGPRAAIPVLAPSSASALDIRHESARWHLIDVARLPAGQWRLQVTVRGLDPETKGFRGEGRFALTLDKLNIAA